MILPSHRFWLVLLSSLLAAGRKGGTEGDGTETADNQTVSPAGTDVNSNPSGSLTSDIGSPTAETTSSNGNRSTTSSFSAITTPVSDTTPSLPIALLPPANATSCMPVSLTWNVDTAQVNNSDMQMMLSITNRGVAQSNSTTNSSGHSRTKSNSYATIMEIITNNTSISSGFFDWSAVTVPSGWYVLQACPPYAMQNSVQQSSPFFVYTHTNTSCINPKLLSMHTSLSPAALAGTVMGALAGVTALVGAFFLPRLWRRGIPGHQAWKDKSKGLYHVF